MKKQLNLFTAFENVEMDKVSFHTGTDSLFCRTKSDFFDGCVEIHIAGKGYIKVYTYLDDVNLFKKGKANNSNPALSAQRVIGFFDLPKAFKNVGQKTTSNMCYNGMLEDDAEILNLSEVVAACPGITVGLDLDGELVEIRQESEANHKGRVYVIKALIEKLEAEWKTRSATKKELEKKKKVNNGLRSKLEGIKLDMKVLKKHKLEGTHTYQDLAKACAEIENFFNKGASK